MSGRAKDRTGIVYNGWTCLKFEYIHPTTNSAHWLSRCECGKEKVVSCKDMVAGTSKSCGCRHEHKATRPRENITGQRFDKWLVLGYSHRKYGLSHWHCRCDCGTERPVSLCHLRGIGSKSCGCVLPHSESLKRKVYGYIKSSAKRRNKEFNLTRKQVATLTQMPCTYCGSPPSNMRTSARGQFIYQGLDRVDNERGYVIDNVTPCCKNCNLMKRKMSRDDFIGHLTKIINHINGQEI